MKTTLLLTAAIVLGGTIAANARVVMECGPSAGYSYYVTGQMPVRDLGGQWQADGIKGGKIALLEDGNKYDIVVTDASGSSFSYKADGGTVVPVIVNEREWVIVTVFPGMTVETHNFTSANGGTGELLWTQVKSTKQPFGKGAAFHATCKQGG